MSASLESQALSGGAILVARQLLGIILSLVAMLVTTRLLGPQKFGQFVIVSGLAGYALNLGKLGLDVYLIRHRGELGTEQVEVTQGLYLVIGLLFSLVCVALGPVLSWWYDDPFLYRLFCSYALIIPVSLMSAVPIALLDRQLLYKQAAMTELVGQLTSVALCVSIVWFSRSVWGLVAGVLGQALVTLFVATLWSRMRFRPRLALAEARAQVQYGLGYSASMWIWQARDLVNPLLVGKILGADAAAYIAMALRVAALVGFAKNAVWRVYMSYLARLADDRDKMKEAIESGLSHQVLISGGSFVVFLAVAPELIRSLMGAQWLPVMDVLPFIAAGVVVNSGFSLYSSALYIVGKNRDVSLFHALFLALFVAAAFSLLHLVGNISAYGIAEVVAFASYFLIRYAFRKRLFAIRESLLYINISLVLCCIALNTQLLSGRVWERVLVASFLLAVILFAVPCNRSSSLVMLKMARRKLAFDKG